MNPRVFLERQYTQAVGRVVGEKLTDEGQLRRQDLDDLDTVIRRAESAKGVFTVLVTSVVYKALWPSQDIRLHQANMTNGYSGRGFDSTYITPFLKDQRFPAMAESGWLTRSLEQNSPYDLNYGGQIRPQSLKDAFLRLLDSLEKGTGDPETFLGYILEQSIVVRDKQKLDLAKPTALPIAKILKLIEQHFDAAYDSEGASRLPVLAVYATYECIMGQMERYRDKQLLPLESHTSADRRSGRIGDVQVDGRDAPFEALEIKFRIPIGVRMVKDAFAKFSTTQVNRYYILSTAPPSKDEIVLMDAEIENIKNVHGCHVIINGVTETVKYYLRLLDDPAKFIAKYVDLIESDGALKYEHRERWNTIVASN
ncbi:MAG: DNA methyltransferase [Chloracidobacterium sp.]|nr:DNA methyltransferase [Chloracidobacterium sp.]